MAPVGAAATVTEGVKFGFTVMLMLLLLAVALEIHEALLVSVHVTISLLCIVELV